MAYITGFEHDIFISYAHVDNLTTSEVEKGWVERFHELLRVKLSKRIGKIDAANIWWDRRMDGTQLFDAEIADAIDKSAIFLALTSPGYSDSDYCQQELRHFFNKAETDGIGLDIGNRRRIVNALLYNIPFKKWPSEYGRATGFPLHDSKEADKLGEPRETSDDLFKKQLRALVDGLYDLISEMSEGHQPEEAKEEKPQESDVFLASVAESLIDTKGRLINRLTHERVVIDQTILTGEKDEQTTRLAVIEALKRSKLSVHLLDDLSCDELASDSLPDCPLEQVRLGLEHSESQLVWVPQSVDIKTYNDEEQRQFIHQLESGVEKTGTYDFLQGSVDEAFRAIIDMLDSSRQILPQLPKRAALLDTHEKDEPRVLEILGSLAEHNIMPYINPVVDDPRSCMDTLRDRLSRVSAVVIIYGSVGLDWVIARLEETVKLVVNERIPIKSFAVYLAPPEKDPARVKPSYPFFTLRLLDNCRGFDPASLKPLYDDLGVEQPS